MSYRPITDVWILGRPKVKYYGAYPAGFLERARVLLVGNDPNARILHVCGGMAKKYNGVHGGITLTGYGKNDITIDMDSDCDPDICCDVNYLLNYSPKDFTAAIIDRPYTEADADKYAPGRQFLPNLNKLLRDTLQVASIVGVLDYQWPSCKEAKEVFVIAVGTGRNNRARWFTGWARK